MAASLQECTFPMHFPRFFWTLASKLLVGLKFLRKIRSGRDISHNFYIQIYILKKFDAQHNQIIAPGFGGFTYSKKFGFRGQQRSFFPRFPLKYSSAYKNVRPISCKLHYALSTVIKRSFIQN